MRPPRRTGTNGDESSTGKDPKSLGAGAGPEPSTPQSQVRGPHPRDGFGIPSSGVFPNITRRHKEFKGESSKKHPPSHGRHKYSGARPRLGIWSSAFRGGAPRPRHTAGRPAGIDSRSRSGVPRCTLRTNRLKLGLGKRGQRLDKAKDKGSSERGHGRPKGRDRGQWTGSGMYNRMFWASDKYAIGFKFQWEEDSD